MVGPPIDVNSRHVPNSGGFISSRTRQRLVDSLRAKGIVNEAVLQAIADTSRHEFVEDALKGRAYEDTALPIGYRQTISQPFVVALMSQILLCGQEMIGRVLEVGAGSGYHAAVLSRFTTQVYSLERVSQLYISAKRRLQRLEINNVHLVHKDGADGWPARAPYDGIMLTAAPHQVSATLFDQLREGGILVAPEGDDQNQTLTYWVKKNGRIQRHESIPVVFVPLVLGVTQ
ncbi:MAG: protein-L-isoaspartate O-methyltransferase [Acidiferrobacteraceae bacterium]|mgnify:FL=1|nr:protein-L-isoaspartate O-methyltransferase [Acidiferrobacteraceae bacterium]